MSLDPSAEVTQMAAAERKKWLTIAEAQRLRKAWDASREAMNQMAGKFDEDPENEQEAMLFVILSALTVDGFMRSAGDATKKLKELMGDGS